MQISKEVDTTRIASDVLIHDGSVIRGEQASIGPGTVIGEQGPVVIDNCQIGKKVHLKGGLLQGCGHIRWRCRGSGCTCTRGHAI